MPWETTYYECDTDFISFNYTKTQTVSDEIGLFIISN